ncbi:hypothetical protein CR513_12356, partial [Mucuna pruriens]
MGRDRDKNKVRSYRSPKKESDPFQGRKEIVVTPSLNAPRMSSIKCFKCLGKGHIASQYPNRRDMIVKDDGKVAKSCSDNSHVEGNLLMVRRLIGSQMVDEAETQRENIFHSRCHVLSNLCSIIIGGGSCVNVKLALPIIVHMRPYRLQWLSEHGELFVNMQVEVAFTLDRYEDKVPIEAKHLLFGRPWQFDKKSGKSNRRGKRKQSLLDGPREVRKVLLAKREPLYAMPVNMLLHTSSSMISLPTNKKYLLKEFKDMFPKDIPLGLLPLRGVKHHIDLYLGANIT